MGILRVAGGQVYSSGDSTNGAEQVGLKARARLVGECGCDQRCEKAEVAGEEVVLSVVVVEVGQEYRLKMFERVCEVVAVLALGYGDNEAGSAHGWVEKKIESDVACWVVAPKWAGVGL